MSKKSSSSAATLATSDPSGVEVGGAANLSVATLRALYRNMVMSRRLDDAEITLRKRNQAYFQISSAGHEAINTALGYCLRAGHDWFFTYYRDRALALQLGVTPESILHQTCATIHDTASCGRQMPVHFSDRSLNIVSTSSSIGTQGNQAAGCAEGGALILRNKLDLPTAKDEIIHVSIGDGATAEGEFHESIHFACIRRLPLLTVVEHNGWAISVPANENIPGGDIAQALSGMPGLEVFSVDGGDIIACIELLTDIVGRMRRREIGPVLLQAFVTRPYSHSLSDNHADYRSDEDLRLEAERDCIPKFARWLTDQGHLTEEDLADIAADVDKEVRAAMEVVLATPKPEPETATDHLYSPDNGPHLPVYDREDKPATEGDALSMGQAINRTLHDEMGRDPRMVVFGEDVADVTDERYLEAVRGKGGVFKITHGLQKKYGTNRCWNAMLAEANIVGRALGLAVRGFRPVVEIQFFDYIWPAMTQIRNEVATMRYRSGGTWDSPIVIRAPIGGYLRGGAIYHSQSGENIFVQCPGLRIVYPSNARDAVGLLRTAIRCDDPVLFLEHKHLYYQGYNRFPYPGEEYTIPFGKAAVRREGEDVTIVTWGALVQKSLEAAERLARDEARSAEVIDIRTLNPLDTETILTSVRKTHRLVVASEEARTGGFGAEIVSRVAENCFEWLDAPVQRVGALDCWVAYSPVLEDAILPDTEGVYDALLRAVRY
jgi:2-oxoisovalerate dehydrogenase E1 component